MRHPIPRYLLENKHLTFGLSVKSVGNDGCFAGYASVFDVIDSQRDVVLPGAFRETLHTRRHEVKLLWQHQFEEPIGTISEIFEDRRGLYIEGVLLLDIARAREAHALLKARALSGLSIGYSPLRYSIDPDSGVRKLSAVELWEVSLVTFPANAEATVTVVKAASTDEREWRAAQETGGLAALQNALDKARNALRS